MAAQTPTAKDLAWFAERFGEGFPRLMGIELLSVEAERVLAKLAP